MLYLLMMVEKPTFLLFPYLSLNLIFLMDPSPTSSTLTFSYLYLPSLLDPPSLPSSLSCFLFCLRYSPIPWYRSFSLTTALFGLCCCPALMARELAAETP